MKTNLSRRSPLASLASLAFLPAALRARQERDDAFGRASVDFFAEVPALVAGTTIPTLTIIALKPQTLSVVASQRVWLGREEQIEILCAFSSTEPVPPGLTLAGVKVVFLPFQRASQVAEQLEDQANQAERMAQTLNLAGRNALGDSILFADLFPAAHLTLALKQFLTEEIPAQSLLRTGQGFIVNAARFRAVGGFVPAFFRLSFGEIEFIYRYFSGFDPTSPKNRGMLDHLALVADQKKTRRALRLFSGIHGETSLPAYFNSEAWRAPSLTGKHLLRARLFNRYGSPQKLADRFRDTDILALLNVYVRIAGLWLSYFLKRRLRFKSNVDQFPFATGAQTNPKLRVFARVTHGAFLFALREIFRVRYFYLKAKLEGEIFIDSVVAAYWYARLHFWKIKKVYWLMLKIFGAVKCQVWKVKKPYHYVRLNAWKLKIVAFKLSFPFRKVYYVAEFQFQKRVLSAFR